MPKPTKLHNKGKPITIQKAYKHEENNLINNDEDSTRQFQLELCWCIQQLERSLREKKGNEKQIQETWKVLTILKNNNQAIIRKRQLMRTHFGDYRAAMASEEKKLAKLASKLKISETLSHPKATYLRKSAFLKTGDSYFRFNFHLNQDQLDDTENNCQKDEIKELSNCDEKSNEAKSITVGQEIKSDENSSQFKFKFSESEFRFNFTIKS